MVYGVQYGKVQNKPFTQQIFQRLNNGLVLLYI